MQEFFDNNKGVCSLVLTWKIVQRIIDAEEDNWMDHNEDIKAIIKGSQLGRKIFSNAASLLQAKAIKKVMDEQMDSLPINVKKEDLEKMCQAVQDQVAIANFEFRKFGLCSIITHI